MGLPDKIGRGACLFGLPTPKMGKAVRVFVIQLMLASTADKGSNRMQRPSQCAPSDIGCCSLILGMQLSRNFCNVPGFSDFEMKKNISVWYRSWWRFVAMSVTRESQRMCRTAVSQSRFPSCSVRGLSHNVTSDSQGKIGSNGPSASLPNLSRCSLLGVGAMGWSFLDKENKFSYNIDEIHMWNLTHTTYEMYMTDS